jgi:hypothetical protein
MGTRLFRLCVLVFRKELMGEGALSLVSIRFLSPNCSIVVPEPGKLFEV